MSRSKGYVGVFDSGFGGLSVLKDIVKAMPQYRYVYLGDTARAPYGTRSAEVVDRFTFEAVDFLFEQGCELVIIACNTASAESLRQVQQQYLPSRYPKRRVLGVVVPTAEEAVERGGKRIGVLATTRTVLSGTFIKELKKQDSTISVFQQAAPLLVPFIEEGEHRSAPAIAVLKQYLQPLLKKRIDTLILGCTHYGHIESAVRRIVGKNVRIISGGRVVARKLKDYLSRHPEVESRLVRRRGITFFTTDLSDRFKRLGSMFYGRKIVPKKSSLEKET